MGKRPQGHAISDKAAERSLFGGSQFDASAARERPTRKQPQAILVGAKNSIAG